MGCNIPLFSSSLLVCRLLRRSGWSSLISVSDGEVIVIADNAVKPKVSESVRCVGTKVLYLRNNSICPNVIDLLTSYMSLSSGIDKLLDEPSGD